ncbi:MAG: hypothetical protein M1815_000130 [Lichina confinis]|nr:MAG: hypothetical protein M1815_000130 [Lichina confinis]
MGPHKEETVPASDSVDVDGVRSRNVPQPKEKAFSAHQTEADDCAGVIRTSSHGDSDASNASSNGGGSDSSISAGGGHKRSLSGGLLPGLSFLRFGRDEVASSPSTWPTWPTQGDATDSEYGLDGTAGPSMQNTSDGEKRHERARKRKGSLRKTALLGTKNMWANPLPSARPVAPSLYSAGTGGVDGIRTSSEMSAAASVESDVFSSSCPATLDPPATTSPLSPPTTGAALSSSPPAPVVPAAPAAPAAMTRRDMNHGGLPGRPLGSPPSGELSTTDEDDFGNGGGGQAYQLLVPTHMALHARGDTSESSVSVSSYPSNASISLPLPRRHTIKRPKSPLSGGSPVRVTPPLGGTTTTTSAAAAAAAAMTMTMTPDEWDYSETEWWGWVVLAVTWLVFVVGMGSSLGVWSWAWDVGETPYAPPELEDDPTLPIVGYYPALLILTLVMAWVWVGVAWLGMKYFRHAKISGEDI